MKSRLLLLVGCLFSSAVAFAQYSSYKDHYRWEASPKIHAIPDSLKSDYPGVIVLQKKVLELVVSSGGEAVTYDSEHKIVHVNNDAGVERFNKVYIPMQQGKTLINISVRSIDKSGKVTEFNAANLKELKNVESYGNFKIFAIEGLTKEGELEYVYTLKTNPQTFGRAVLQNDVPVQDASFQLIYPERFFFSTKGYNGVPKPESRSLTDGRRHQMVTLKNIPALIEEPFSSYRANLMRVDFKFDGNTYQAAAMSWASVSERLLKYFYDDAAQSKISRMLDAIKVDGLKPVDAIRKVESHIKSNFTVREGSDEAYEDLKEILASHVANERGIVKLYISIFRQIGVQPQLVFACNRNASSIDPEFATYSDLDELMFYFDAYKLYLTPKQSYTRLGFAPGEYAGTKALFIDYTKDKVEYLRSKVKVIEPLDYLLNDEGVNATIKFGDDFSDLVVDMEKRWQGYRATAYRGIYYYQPEAKRDEFLNSMCFSGIDNYKVISRTVEGHNLELSGDPAAYMKIKTNFKTSSMVEKAGDDYLVSIGKIIGKQNELYQEKKRQSDISFHEPSNYNHKIVLEIPAGYKCSGLEAIKINNKVVQNGEDVMYFNSDYTLENNKLTINVTEVYKIVNLPLSSYDDFRKMINSAADFNKVVLVLQPTNP